METDKYGVVHVNQDFLVNELYKNPAQDIFDFLLDDPAQFNNSNRILHAEYPTLKHYENLGLNLNEFDNLNQSVWFMPDKYKEMDICKYILDRCSGDAELQNAGEELLMYIDRNLIDLLRYLKYLVDTLRKNNVVLGVGRGSSVASFVLYLIGVHKINSLYFNLNINEFLK